MYEPGWVVQALFLAPWEVEAKTSLIQGVSRLQAGFKTNLGDLTLWFVGFFPTKEPGSDSKKAQWVKVLLPRLTT